jgi:hypothetical protein
MEVRRGHSNYDDGQCDFPAIVGRADYFLDNALSKA